jgi:hypothetical protein
MTQRIIHKTPVGGASVIIPTGELPIEEVAAYDYAYVAVSVFR